MISKFIIKKYKENSKCKTQNFRLRMEIICAGFPKTGTKSCTAALRTLGYSVADYPETLEFLGETWLEFMNGKIDASTVIEKYIEQGFNVNQDFPGNFMWEEIYQASSLRNFQF